MICPKCKHIETRVIDSREGSDGRETRRRRACAKCDHRFTTFERVETANFTVIKRDGSRESYDREKVEKGIRRACEKRSVSQEVIDKVIDELEGKWATLGKEVQSKLIGQGVMNALKKVDEVAYIRFASVYRQFKDVESFKREVSKLLE